MLVAKLIWSMRVSRVTCFNLQATGILQSLDYTCFKRWEPQPSTVINTKDREIHNSQQNAPRLKKQSRNLNPVHCHQWYQHSGANITRSQNHEAGTRARERKNRKFDTRSDSFSKTAIGSINAAFTPFLSFGDLRKVTGTRVSNARETAIEIENKMRMEMEAGACQAQ